MTFKKDGNKKDYRRTEIAMWANEHALISGVVILIGGIVGLFNFSGWPFAGYAVFIGFFIITYEYPRGQREDGVCMRRRGQDVVEPFVSFMCRTFCFNGYGKRAAFYFMMSLPCGCCLPVVMGGLSLLFASFLYFISSLRNETRKTPEVKQVKRWKKKSTIREPKHPPPRLIRYNSGGSPFLKDPRLVKPSIILSEASDRSDQDVESLNDFNLLQVSLDEDEQTKTESSEISENSDNSLHTNLNASELSRTGNKQNGGIINRGFRMEVIVGKETTNELP
ncbi:cytochrome b-245 light chain-like [Antedon mediterranea]|uniref:cytochrome b-245 light chain-like n=1 Tax=Antedon mediterranea TaxID=105859 RepID=UPI003AF88CE8